jgi:hypothetical protein
LHFSDSDREIPDYFPSCEDIFPLDDEFTPKEPHKIMDDFRNSVIDEDSQTQIFRVSRMNGGAEMQSDILSHYKNPSTRLKSPLKIRFEGEDGVGVGPIREFFVEALTIVEEGIGNPRVLMFEGESDHKVPVHSPQMRQTGAYKAVGKIIGHSILHGGPGLYGLSPAVKHYFSTKDLSLFPPPLQVEDIPYYDLRECVDEVSFLLIIRIKTTVMIRMNVIRNGSAYINKKNMELLAISRLKTLSDAKYINFFFLFFALAS